MYNRGMKILVINGSPKGKNSITLQTMLYLEKLNPQDSFAFLDAAQQIHSLEKDFKEAMNMIYDADLLLFAYPVYTFGVPSQLYRFIELMKENKLFLGAKYATQFTTSKHFYDVTAHNFIQQNCQDMKLRFIKGLSADMEDLTKEEGRREAEDFFKYVKFSVENGLFETFAEVPHAEKTRKIFVPRKQIERMPGKVTLLTDATQEDTQLLAMIERFRVMLPYALEVYNLNDLDMKGGCLGCLHCAPKGECIYKDGYAQFLKNVQSANAMVTAFTIKNHWMSSRFKMYDDRQFANGHRTITEGTPVAYLVSGNLDAEPNLRMVLKARADMGGNFLAGIATDQHNAEQEIDAIIKKLVYAVENSHHTGSTFYKRGGTMIFRDMIFVMSGFMRADHKFFKKTGMYDFPQKKIGQKLLMILVGFLMKVPFIKKQVQAKMSEGMLMPFKKVLESLETSEN